MGYKALHGVFAGWLTLSGQVIAAQCETADQWYFPERQAVASSDAWLAELRDKSVILIGEHHDNAAHHQWQLRVLKTLLATQKQALLGFEMLPRSRQNVLDEWFRGTAGNAPLREALQWDSVWSFNFDYYYPLLETGRAAAAGLLALNAEAELVASVRTVGWDQSPSHLRGDLYPPAPPSRDYLRLLAASFLGHVPPGGAASDAERKQRFLRFVQGQQVWDSVMAQSIATALRQQPAATVIAFMGSWHLIDGGGVPHQLSQLGVTDMAILVPWDEHLDCAGINPGYAHAIFGLDYRQ